MTRIVALLAALLILSTCENVVTPLAVNPRTTYSIRVFPAPEHGSLTLSAFRAMQGDVVTVYVNPDPGYVLKDQGLIAQPEVDGNPSGVPLSGGKYQLTVTQYNVAVTAAFVPKTTGFTVSVDRELVHGKVSVFPQNAAAGTPVRIVLIPDAGYDLEAGTLRLDDGTPVSETVPYMLSLPARDVTVSARFAEQDYTGLLAAAGKYLDVGEYDTAASFYKEAYKKNNAAPETIFYSTFAELGALLIDPDVRALMSLPARYDNSFNPPSTLDGWICDDDWQANGGGVWYGTWPGVSGDTTSLALTNPAYASVVYSTEDATLPNIHLRGSNFVTPFGDFDISTKPATTQKFYNVLFWSLIASNTGGFNGLVEKVNRYLFGDQFEAIAARAAAFPADGRVLLNPRLKARFGLADFYGDADTYVGKAELDYVFANLRAVKALFEYLSVYDLTIDLRPALTTEIHVDDGLDQILHFIFNQAGSNDTHKAYWKTPAEVANILPFKNNFLNVRNAAVMNNAKTDLSSALTLANAAFTSWYDGGTTTAFTADAKASRRWVRDGIAAAKAALDSGGVFYFPKELPPSLPSSQWVTSDTADYGLSVSRFFTPGAFSLSTLFTTEWGGRAPSLFKLEWYEDRANSYAAVFTGNYTLVTEPIPTRDGGQNVNGTVNSAPYGIYSFEVNTAYLKELFPKGFNGYGDKELLSTVFKTIPLWPKRPTYFIGGAANLTARQLYYYYHWR
ncbi:MAG: hypothetical protein LBQ88_07380 [Treponema sp.]|jgi:hypothetical protein|nr:hypothetical protein [Treponema sp.]